MSLLRTFFLFLRHECIQPHHLLLLSVLFTSLHATSFTDFGFSHEASANFMIWHFVHRSYAHGLGNFLFLFLLAGSALRISLLEILGVSSFVYALGYFDMIPFYGSSGLVFLLIGKIISSKLLLESYPFLSTKVQIPYALSVIMVLSLMTPTSNTTTTVDFLHIFSLFFGMLFPLSAHSSTQAAAASTSHMLSSS